MIRGVSREVELDVSYLGEWLTQRGPGVLAIESAELPVADEPLHLPPRGM